MKILAPILALSLWLGLSWYEVDILRAEYHFHRGEKARTVKDWAGALAQYEEAARIIPDRATYQRAVGQLSYRLYQPASGNLRPLYRAEDAYRRMVRLDPLYPYGWFERANVLDDFEEAKVTDMPSSEACYRKAVEIDPSNPRFLAGMLDWKLRHGQKEAAWVLFYQLIRSYPRAVSEVGPAMLQNDQDLARLEREIDPSSPAAIELARYLVRSGHDEQALEVLRKIKSDADTRLDVARLISFVLVSQRKWDMAREVVTHALKLAPDDMYLNRQLAKILEQQGDAAGALEVYQRIMDLNPGRSDLPWMAFQVARKAGRDDEAIVFLTRVLDADDTSDKLRKQALNLRAGLRAKHQHFGEALADYERLLELDPGNDDVVFAIKKVKYQMEYGDHTGN